MRGEEIHQELYSNFKRLHAQFYTWENKMSKEMKDKIFRSFIMDSIFSKLPSKIALKVIKASNSYEGLLTSFEIEEVFTQANHIIELMKKANDWTEFEELEQGKEVVQKKLTDFDKILGAMLKVPKPKKEKDKKEKDSQ